MNKVESKVVVRWHVGNSVVFNDEQKMSIRATAGKRLNQADEIVVDSDESRSQMQNREAAINRLNEIVTEALKPIKKRRATKPSRSQKEKRLVAKKQISAKKEQRKSLPFYP